jgi:chromatin structure-remodeling complex subunit RSC1/2
MTTKTDLAGLFNGQTEEGISKVLDQLTTAQKMARQQELEREMHIKEREESRRIAVTGMTARLEEKY